MVVYDVFLSILIRVRSKSLVAISEKSSLSSGKGLSLNLSVSESSVVRRRLFMDLMKVLTSRRWFLNFQGGFGSSGVPPSDQFSNRLTPRWSDLWCNSWLWIVLHEILWEF